MLLGNQLEVTLTKDRNGQPLVVVESALGNGLELYPAKLRALAAAMCKAADDAESCLAKHPLIRSKKVSYDLL